MSGPLAHLVERLICNEEVTGSIPVGSTKHRKTFPAGGFLVLWKPQRCFALAKPRGGVEKTFCDGKKLFVTTCGKRSHVFAAAKTDELGPWKFASDEKQIIPGHKIHLPTSPSYQSC